MPFSDKPYALPVKVDQGDEGAYDHLEAAAPPPEGQAEGVCVIILLVELKGQEAGDGASLEPPHEEEANRAEIGRASCRERV